VRPAATADDPGLARPGFVVAGAGELVDGALTESGIVRRGETGPDALAAKMDFVAKVIEARLNGLEASWSDTTAVVAYTAHVPPGPALMQLWARLGGAAGTHGLQWVLSRPPVTGIEYEMDARACPQEITLHT
jgi:hypothetical protein